MRDELGQIKAAIAGLWHLQKGDSHNKELYFRFK